MSVCTGSCLKTEMVPGLGGPRPAGSVTVARSSNPGNLIRLAASYQNLSLLSGLGPTMKIPTVTVDPLLHVMTKYADNVCKATPTGQF